MILNMGNFRPVRNATIMCENPSNNRITWTDNRYPTRQGNLTKKYYLLKGVNLSRKLRRAQLIIQWTAEKDKARLPNRISCPNMKI